jgi:hypothetical protein
MQQSVSGGSETQRPLRIVVEPDVGIINKAQGDLASFYDAGSVHGRRTTWRESGCGSASM